MSASRTIQIEFPNGDKEDFLFGNDILVYT